MLLGAGLFCVILRGTIEDGAAKREEGLGWVFCDSFGMENGMIDLWLWLNELVELTAAGALIGRVLAELVMAGVVVRSIRSVSSLAGGGVSIF